MKMACGSRCHGSAIMIATTPATWQTQTSRTGLRTPSLRAEARILETWQARWDQAAGKVTCGPKKGKNACRLSACRYVQLEVTSTATDSTRRPAVSLSGAVERT